MALIGRGLIGGGWNSETIERHKKARRRLAIVADYYQTTAGCRAAGCCGRIRQVLPVGLILQILIVSPVAIKSLCEFVENLTVNR